jgi:hypothetical protein
MVDGSGVSQLTKPKLRNHQFLSFEKSTIDLVGTKEMVIIRKICNSFPAINKINDSSEPTEKTHNTIISNKRIEKEYQAH